MLSLMPMGNRPNPSLGPKKGIDTWKTKTSNANKGIGADEVFDKNPYENLSYDYKVNTLNDPQKVLNQNYDLQRQGALKSVGAGAQSGSLGAMSSLASSGGLSESDRQAISAQGQRQRVNLSQGALSPYDQMQSQNMYDTQKYNAGMQQQTDDANANILNQKARDVATQNEKISTNIYQQRMQEAMLQRQLEAARVISQGQLNAPKQKTAIEKILNPFDIKI